MDHLGWTATTAQRTIATTRERSTMTTKAVHVEVVRFSWGLVMVPTMTKTNLMTMALPLVLALTACTGTAQATQPSPPPVVQTPAPAPTTTPTPTPSGDPGAYRTGEAVGETARDAWETTKEFGRGLWNGFQLDGEEGK